MQHIPRPATADQVRELRAAVLRPGLAPEQVVYPGDSDPLAFHAAVERDGRLLAIATVHPDPFPDGGVAGDWRLRGMATAPEARRTGAGRAALELCHAHVRSRGAQRLWCHAREIAVPFYLAMGYGKGRGPYDIPGIGPHYLMWICWT